MDFDRDPFEIPVDAAGRVRILVRTGGRPRIEVYAVRLQAMVDGSRKVTPEHFAYGTVHEVIPQAIRYMRDHYEPIIESWRP